MGFISKPYSVENYCDFDEAKDKAIIEETKRITKQMNKREIAFFVSSFLIDYMSQNYMPFDKILLLLKENRIEELVETINSSIVTKQ